MDRNIDKNELIENIEEALFDEELSIFVGAGLSVGAGYPDWKGLLSKAAHILKLDIEKEKHDLVSLAQFYKNHRNRGALDEIISKAFSEDLEPTENHRILAKLPIKTYWTTNFDHLIETSLKEEGKKVSTRTEDCDLKLSVNNYDAVVYKMHGDKNNPNNVVITRDDYEEYGIMSRKLFRHALEENLLKSTFLFLGFSFDDPNFKFTIGKMRTLLEGNTRPHYCIFKRVAKPLNLNENDEKAKEALENYNLEVIKQELQIEDLARYGINVYLVDDYSEITDILKIIYKRFKRKIIFISGSAKQYNPLDEKEAVDLIRKLVFKLVEKGYKIVNGYGLGVGTYVINGVSEYCYDYNKKNLTDSLKLMPFPLSAASDEKLKEIWKKYRQEMISYCGIAIYMFGNKEKDGQIINADGVKEEFRIANKHGVVNIPLKFTGSMAEELYSSSKLFEILSKDELDVIENFSDVDKNVDGIVKIIDKISKRSE